MKKLLVLIIAALCCWTEGMCEMSTSKGGTRAQEVKIYVSDITVSRPRPRSGLPIIEAEVDAMAGQLVMYFNYELGKVTVNVKNSMGQVVSRYCCDTDMEPMAVIIIPTADDSYSVSITGENIEAYGNYDIYGD